jgi:hypothetical protein
MRGLGLQGEIAAGFLKANGKGRTNGNGNGHTNGNNGSGPHGNNGDRNGDVPADAMPGLLLGVASMNTRRGPGLFLSVLVNDKVLKLFGTQEQLGKAVAAAGYPPLAGRLVDGFTLNLPCRVVTKPNGKYINIERVYPAEAAAPARV